MIVFDVITLFPELFKKQMEVLPLKKALDKGLISVKLHRLRDYAVDKRGSVDDKPYGGGIGMILRPEPVFDAVFDIEKDINPNEVVRKVVLSPSGEKYTQDRAADYSGLDRIILICGRYEGLDQRIKDFLADETISIGDYVLSGGELPAMVIMESVTRLIPGVLDKEEAARIESFSDGELEFPQYTRPEEYRGMKVPEVLLSGNHEKIEEWRKNHQKPVK